MTEITRVPIQPVAKGSLTKLWLGVVIAILLGAGLAWTAIPKGLSIETVVAGEGPSPTATDWVFVRYKGMLADTGEVFDETQDIPIPVEGIFPEGTPLPLDRMLPGFTAGLTQMQKGGEYVLYIPADQAYGAEPPPNAPIPPDADLIFEIELVDFMSNEEFERKANIIQQVLQAGGPPEGVAPPPAPGN